MPVLFIPLYQLVIHAFPDASMAMSVGKKKRELSINVMLIAKSSGTPSNVG